MEDKELKAKMAKIVEAEATMAALEGLDDYTPDNFQITFVVPKPPGQAQMAIVLNRADAEYKVVAEAVKKAAVRVRNETAIKVGEYMHAIKGVVAK